jgi:hypothetical protein
MMTMDTLRSKFTTILVSALKTSRSRGHVLVLLAALGLILRRRAREQSLLITDLNHVGRTEGQKGSVEDEFDVVILGGGKYSNVDRFQLPYVIRL